MPRPAVYGKRSRVVYDPTAANFSSPEQQWQKPTKTTAVKTLEIPAKANESKKRAGKVERKALGERSHNTVVLPVEVIQYAKDEPTPKRKPQAKRPQHIIFDSDDEGENEKEKEAVVTEDRTKHTTVVQEKARDTTRLKPASPKKPVVRKDSQPVVEVQSGPQELDLPQEPEIQQEETFELDPNDPYQQHCSSLLNLSLHPLGSFSTWSSQLSSHFAITKIAEASFGEVYRLSLLEAIPDISRTDESVFKIIPLRTPSSLLPKDKRKRKAILTKQEMMSKPEDVSNEVKLLQRMSAIPGFTNFRDVRILQGRPPEAFCAAFKSWNQEQKSKKKDLSHFPDPSKKASYTEDQLWAVIEMQDAGSDLQRLVENKTCTSIWTIWDIFWQIVLSLAKGEEGAEFEHRDLHLGNICVRDPSASQGKDTEIDPKRKLGFTPLETTIIDYTISRCIMPDSTVAYQDLAPDPALFEGDSTEEYQYDIYRYMRSVFFLDNALAEFHTLSDEDIEATGRHWEQYHPQTNLVWLHLVLYKLLEQVEWPSATKAPARKTKKEEYKKWKRANDLEHVLLKVQDLLDPGQICENGIWSAGDIVVLALGEGWLDVEDVVGHGEGEESALISQLEGLELR